MWVCVKATALLEDCVDQGKHTSIVDQIWRKMESLTAQLLLIAVAVPSKSLTP